MRQHVETLVQGLARAEMRQRRSCVFFVLCTKNFKKVTCPLNNLGWSVWGGPWLLNPDTSRLNPRSITRSAFFPDPFTWTERYNVVLHAEHLYNSLFPQHSLTFKLRCASHLQHWSHLKELKSRGLLTSINEKNSIKQVLRTEHGSETSRPFRKIMTDSPKDRLTTEPIGGRKDRLMHKFHFL